MVDTPRKHSLKSFINFYKFRTPQTYSASQYFTTLLYLIFYQYFTALYFTAVTDGTVLKQMNVVAGFCAGCRKIFHKQAGWMGAPDESGGSLPSCRTAVPCNRGSGPVLNRGEESTRGAEGPFHLSDSILSLRPHPGHWGHPSFRPRHPGVSPNLVPAG